MRKNTTTTTTVTGAGPDEAIATVADALAAHPDGATARALVTATGLNTSAVSKALSALQNAGTATRTGAGGKPRATDTWTPVAVDNNAVTPDTTDAPTDTDPTPEPAPNHDDPAPVSGPPSAEPVSGGPAGSADHRKIAMVAGILGDHPDGVTAAALVDESGLRAAIVGRVLAAMEIADAAARATDPRSGEERWTRAEADLDTVSLTNVTTYQVCPHCGHRARVRNGVTIRRTGPTAAGHNGDGQATLGKNELRGLVRDFLTAHPGHEFTAGTISKELNRSSGAIGNALAKLVITGEATLVKEAPMTYSAATADETATATAQ